MKDSGSTELEVNDAEREALRRLSSGESPNSQRAAALLALAGGAGLEEAAASSGLTTNQVRFWLGRFRGGRLAIFPDAGNLGGLQPGTADISLSPAQKTTIVPAAESSKAPKKEKQDKKRKEKKAKEIEKEKERKKKKKSAKSKKDGKGKKNKGKK